MTVETYSRKMIISERLAPHPTFSAFTAEKPTFPPRGRLSSAPKGAVFFFVQSAEFAQKLYTCHPLLIVIVLKTKYHITAIICKGMDRDCLSVPL